MTSVDRVSLHPRIFSSVAIGAYRERRAGRRTVAGVKANDEARLLLDFFRHRDGRDVVDRWVQSRKSERVILARLCGGAKMALAVSRHVLSPMFFWTAVTNTNQRLALHSLLKGLYAQTIFGDDLLWSHHHRPVLNSFTGTEEEPRHISTPDANEHHWCQVLTFAVLIVQAKGAAKMAPQDSLVDHPIDA